MKWKYPIYSALFVAAPRRNHPCLALNLFNDLDTFKLSLQPIMCRYNQVIKTYESSIKTVPNCTDLIIQWLSDFNGYF